MKIEELIGEMGEVVIRGKVLSVDTRDIKNEKTIIISISLIYRYHDHQDVRAYRAGEGSDRGHQAGSFLKGQGNLYDG